MNNNLLPSNHYFINAAKEVTEICNPFFKAYKLNAFYYARIYDDGSLYGLISHANYLRYHFKEELMIGPEVPQCFLKDKFYFLGVPCDSQNFNQMYYAARTLFDLDYPLYFVERYCGYFDLYSFAASAKNYNIINCYMNNIDLFESFKAFFREKAASLIAQANKNKIIIPVHMRPSFSGLLPHEEDVNSIKLLKERTKNLNQCLQMHFNTKLTSRELQTLSHLLRGRTALETSKDLNISPKTVEFYIDSVKSKFDCLTRAELFDKALESNLINLIIKL